MTERLVWIDCEMTGLSLGSDALIEVAALVTDSDLTVLGDGVDIVIHADDAALAAMEPVVRDMHARSGLTEAVRESTVTLAEAEQRVLDYVTEFVPDPKSAPLCGNSIATDRGFLARDMPLLDEYLHYRMVDVSSVKELCRRWYPRVYFGQPHKGLAHRALADIVESIRELRYYRETIFVPLPGPDVDAARATASAILAADGVDPATLPPPKGEPKQDAQPDARADAQPDSQADAQPDAKPDERAGTEPAEGGN